jgi:hypothetical protein
MIVIIHHAKRQHLHPHHILVSPHHIHEKGLSLRIQQKFPVITPIINVINSRLIGGILQKLATRSHELKRGRRVGMSTTEQLHRKKAKSFFLQRDCLFSVFPTKRLSLLCFSYKETVSSLSLFSVSLLCLSSLLLFSAPKIPKRLSLLCSSLLLCRSLLCLV